MTRSSLYVPISEPIVALNSTHSSEPAASSSSGHTPKVFIADAGEYLYGRPAFGTASCGTTLLADAFKAAGWSRTLEFKKAWAGVHHIWSETGGTATFTNAAGTAVSQGATKFAFNAAVEAWSRRCSPTAPFYPETLPVVASNEWCNRIHRAPDNQTATWVVKEAALTLGRGGGDLRVTTIAQLRQIAMQACSGSACSAGGCCCQYPAVLRALESTQLINGSQRAHGTLLFQRALEPPLLMRGSRVAARDYVVAVHWVTGSTGAPVDMGWLLSGFLLRAASRAVFKANQDTLAAFKWEELPAVRGDGRTRDRRPPWPC